MMVCDYLMYNFGRSELCITSRKPVISHQQMMDTQNYMYYIMALMPTVSKKAKQDSHICFTKMARTLQQNMIETKIFHLKNLHIHILRNGSLMINI